MPSHARMIMITLMLTSAVLAGAPRAQAGVGGDPATDPRVHSAVQAWVGTDQYTQQTLAGTRAPDGRLQFALTLDGEVHQVVLQPKSVRAPGFRVRVQDASGDLRAVAAPAARTCRGYLAGVMDSSVAASVTGGAIEAQIRIGNDDPETWIVQPLSRIVPGAPEQSHVVYRASDVPPTEGYCATVTPERVDLLPPMAAAQLSTSLDVVVCEIACDADVEFYQLNNSSVDDTVADIETVINGVSAIYELDIRMTFQITEIIVRTAEPDPYSTANPYALLEQVRTQWNTYHGDIPRDVTQLFTGRALSGGPIGIAFVRCVCWAIPKSYSVVRSRWTTDLAQRIALSAHEIAHNFDANHCDYGDYWCRIMCSSITGCSGGIRSFGPYAIEDMRSYAATLDCLAPGTVDVPSTEIPFFDDFTSGLDPARWTAVDQAYVSYRRLELEAGGGYGDDNELGTARTLPMPLHEPATISYLTQPDASLPASEMLKVEYFNSTLYQWELLEDVLRGNESTSQYNYHELAAPPEAYGDYFALRFSAYGTHGEWTDDWRVDDVRVMPDALIPPAISTWEVVVTHGGSDVAAVIEDGYVEGRASGVTRLRACFTKTMDTSVTDPAVVSIVGAISGDLSGTVTDVTWTLDTCMMITLAAALPDGDTYTITLATDVQSASGLPLEGDRQLTMSTLIGDADGSGLVDNSDMIQVRVHRGQTVTEDNGRYDVTCDGVIDNSDMIQVRVRRGHQLP